MIPYWRFKIAEFTTPWNSIKDSAFTKVVKYLWPSKHKTIPPGAKTWQSDVETSHRLIEDEFYAFEEFNTRRHFYDKAAQYQRWFNLEPYNSCKKGTPLQIAKQACGEDFDPEILVFKPILIDVFYRQDKDLIRALAACSKPLGGGDHVYSDPSKILNGFPEQVKAQATLFPDFTAL